MIGELPLDLLHARQERPPMIAALLGLKPMWVDRGEIPKIVNRVSSHGLSEAILAGGVSFHGVC